MAVPTNAKLRQTAGMVDKIGNFGSFPPTEAYRDKFLGQGLLLNLTDPDCTAAQVIGVRSHKVWCGVWYPVPPAGENGAARAGWINSKIAQIDVDLQAANQAKVDICWLNLEGYTTVQWRAFLWGISGARGWRGKDGVVGSTGGYRSGLATGVVDEPFKDGSIKPHKDFMAARIQLGVEGFYGPVAGQNPDMTPADHVRAVIDRLTGFRSDGTTHADEAYPAAQVVGCYDAALGSIVNPKQPLLLRGGLHFTVERARQVGLL